MSQICEIWIVPQSTISSISYNLVTNPTQTWLEKAKREKSICEKRINSISIHEIIGKSLPYFLFHTFSAKGHTTCKQLCKCTFCCIYLRLWNSTYLGKGIYCRVRIKKGKHKLELSQKLKTISHVIIILILLTVYLFYSTDTKNAWFSGKGGILLFLLNGVGTEFDKETRVFNGLIIVCYI